ncbi:MAG: hypothetical protein ACHQEB_03570 [Chitinophagales bacterium]
MKKIFTLSLILALVTVAASAQQGRNDRIRKYRMEQGFNGGRSARPERFQMRKEQFRNRIAQRKARGNRFAGPRVRRRIMMMRRHGRRQPGFYRNNGRRVI